MKQKQQKNRRILVIDDNESIHKDFREILEVGGTKTAALDETKGAILGDAAKASEREGFEIDSAFQGAEGLAKVKKAFAEGKPYAMAFVDVRMPPGWDGIETIGHLWAEYPELEVVICTAYSDYQWSDIIDRFGQTDQLLILKKPFDNVEVRQLACALTEKWSLGRQTELKQEELEDAVAKRTSELSKTNEQLKREIAERTQAENALRVSEEKYRTQFEEAMDAIFVAEVETGILIDCNAEALRLVGREKKELIGQHQKILHPPDKIEGGFSRTFKQHLSKKEGEALETQVITKTGELRDVAIKANIFELGGKRVLQGAFRDITERKRAEDAIEQSERFLENILNSIQDGISVLDSDFRIVRVNDGMRLWYSHMLPLEGKKCYHAYHGRSEPCEVCPTRRAFQTGKISMDEVALNSTDGTTGTLELFSFPIVDDNGKTTGVVEYVRDITDRKLAEQKLREQDRLKTEFVVNVSHELRTPLTIFKNIISNLKAGVAGKMNNEQLKNLEVADKEINRLARIISDFLDVSRIEAGKTNLRMQQVKVQSLISDVVELLRPLADEKNMELTVSMADADLFVDVDRDRMIQVLANLINNAIKFVPDCDGKIAVQVRELDDKISIAIEDNGPGIEMEDKSKVFDRFVQGKKCVGQGYQGTGLGLAISKELVELHGGRIDVESEMGRGTTFRVFLPLVHQYAAEAAMTT